MWRFICRCTAVFLACFLFCTTTSVFAYPHSQVTTVARDLINQFRNRNGLASFQANEQLATAAQRHAEYMANVAFVDHYDANGNRVDVRAVSAGYEGRVTELIFGSSGDAGRAVGWWRESELHRTLLLSQRYVEIGVGAAVNNNDGWTYWVVVLGDGTGDEVATGELVANTPVPAVVDPAVLVPTATPVVLPTLTPIPIPTVTSFPTAVSTAILIERVATVVPVITPLLEPTVQNTSFPTETPLPIEIASSETSSPSTLSTEGLPDLEEEMLDDPVLDETSFPLSEATRANRGITVFAILSILLSPLLIYFWLGRSPTSPTGD